MSLGGVRLSTGWRLKYYTLFKKADFGDSVHVGQSLNDV
jgi:hypothetical protein